MPKQKCSVCGTRFEVEKRDDDIEKQCSITCTIEYWMKSKHDHWLMNLDNNFEDETGPVKIYHDGKLVTAVTALTGFTSFKNTCGNPKCVNPEHHIEVASEPVLVKKPVIIKEKKIKTIKTKIIKENNKDETIIAIKTALINYYDGIYEELALKYNKSTQMIRRIHSEKSYKEVIVPGFVKEEKKPKKIKKLSTKKEVAYKIKSALINYYDGIYEELATKYNKSRQMIYLIHIEDKYKDVIVPGFVKREKKTDDTAIAIKTALINYYDGIYEELALKYNKSRQMIYLIHSERTYKNVIVPGFVKKEKKPKKIKKLSTKREVAYKIKTALINYYDGIYEELALKYNISKQAIYKIHAEKSYKDVIVPGFFKKEKNKDETIIAIKTELINYYDGIYEELSLKYNKSRQMIYLIHSERAYKDIIVPGFVKKEKKTDDKIIAIKTALINYYDGIYKELSSKYDISVEMIRLIHTEKSYKNVIVPGFVKKEKKTKV